jgi:hypothetical protein
MAKGKLGFEVTCLAPNNACDNDVGTFANRDCRWGFHFAFSESCEFISEGERTRGKMLREDNVPRIVIAVRRK